MRAKIRFVKAEDYAVSHTIVCPCIMIGRAEARRMWDLMITIEKKINNRTYEANVRWTIAPNEQDFGKGVKFQLIGDVKKYVDGSSKFGMIADGELLG